MRAFLVSAALRMFTVESVTAAAVGAARAHERRVAARQRADARHRVQVGALVGLVAQRHRGVIEVTAAIDRLGLVDEAQDQDVGLRLLDPDQQTARRKVRRRLGAALGVRQRRQPHPVTHLEAAEVQRARQFGRGAVFRARIDRRAAQPQHELLRVLGASHQPAPQLRARQRHEQRIERVVDLDQMFEAHGSRVYRRLRTRRSREAPGRPGAGWRARNWRSPRFDPHRGRAFHSRCNSP